ncbi:MAG: hypothetical protein N2053_00660 [Chitinispirillaceae bacterium]|nr:hypothetical protein [Chitinispirillaceae bacterium]
MRKEQSRENTLFDNVENVFISPSSLAISKEKVAFLIGYPNNKIPEYFNENVERVIKSIPQLCRIKAGYNVLDIESKGKDFINVGGEILNVDKIIASQLKDAERVAIFLCTIGEEMEMLATQLFSSGEATEGHFVDTIASVAVEECAEILHNYVAFTFSKKGLNVTNRYSPGYCGWQVSEQKKLFSFLPPQFCGVQLTESFLMKPKKSVSGIIGIGRDVKREPYFCMKCHNKKCIYHRFLLSRQKI